MKHEKATSWMYLQTFIYINFGCILAFVYMNILGLFFVPYLGLSLGMFVSLLLFNLIGPWCMSLLVYMSSIRFYQLSKSFSSSKKVHGQIYMPVRNIPVAMASIWLFLTLASVFHEQRMPWHTAAEIILLVSSAGMVVYAGYRAMQSVRALDTLVKESGR